MDDGGSSAGIDRSISLLRRGARGPGARVDASATRLRVVHLVSSLAIGGMEQFVLRLARAQRAAGHPVSVLSIREGPLAEDARTAGVPARVLGGRSKVTRVLSGIAHFARTRPHILHVHNPPSLPYGMIGRRVSGARLVMTHHGQLELDVLSPAAQRRIDALVAVSDAVRNALTSQGMADRRGSVTVVRNGVEMPAPRRGRSEVRADLGLTTECVGIIVARIDRFKGHRTLLRVLAEYARKDLVVLVAGDGPERAAIEAEAQGLRLAPTRVRFLGFRSDVADLLAAADFFVLPSLTEGLPLSVLEAMAAALPVISTPVGGVPEVVRDGEEGLLVPVDDGAALGQAIDQLARDPGLRKRLASAARRRAEQSFSFDNMARRYEELYYGLLA
jgi:glycosyltransferase involved in cell wall biosynthesis